ncbi:hypothetical protein [Tistrella sp.]|uniref:hypothetical protein n=1 Tax=Tistrella sp. TaxID=2024861 RepID=UPI0025F4F7AA|nr:hypothetical protein [Tistrella sp.]|tara:strand:- start:867 stop:1019 length:153 start_codon:yes stop_codon:yes gene_type:complete
MRQLLYATTILAAAAALPLSGATAAGQMQDKPAATESQRGAAMQRDWNQA